MPMPNVTHSLHAASTWGFAPTLWEQAKQEALSALIARARGRAMITYTELVAEIRAISLQPHDLRLDDLLRQLAVAEAQAGRGMITALVVHKHGDMEPGRGFFELAGKLGRDTSDQTACWIAEVKKIYRVWQP
jgi:hypothetical protein